MERGASKSSEVVTFPSLGLMAGEGRLVANTAGVARIVLALCSTTSSVGGIRGIISAGGETGIVAVSVVACTASLFTAAVASSAAFLATLSVALLTFRRIREGEGPAG